MKRTRSSSLWLSTMLLAGVVLVPSVAAIGSVAIAVHNQRLATLKRLEDAYESHVTNAREVIRERLQELRNLDDHVSQRVSPSVRFAELIRSGEVNSAICRNDDESSTYPSLDSTPLPSVPEFGDWVLAAGLENQSKYADAANVFAGLADAETDASLRLLAVQAEVRCLLGGGQRSAAAERLLQVFRSMPAPNANHAAESALIANLELLACESVFEGDARTETLQRLKSRVVDYSPGGLAAPQRLFIMKRLHRMDPEWTDHDFMAAEQIASIELTRRSPSKEFDVLKPSPRSQRWLFPIPQTDLWTLRLANHDDEAILDQASLRHLLQSPIEALALPDDLHIAVLPSPSEATKTSQQVRFRSIPLSTQLPEWTIGYWSSDSMSSGQLAYRQSVGLIALCGLMIGMSLLGGLLLTVWFHRRIRVTQLKSDLLGTVSHELKTPLSSIRLFVDTLLHDQTKQGKSIDTDRLHDYLRLIHSENERLSRLIENFLTFSRLDAGGLALSRDPVAPIDVANLAMATCQSKFDSAGIRLNRDDAPDLPCILGDEASLVCVIANLLDNACKHSRATQVTLKLHIQNDGVAFAVTDDGIGIPRSQRRSVFERFHQVDQNLNRKSEGCGLGLSIVQEIVQQHGGTVALQSEKGISTTFTVWIPAMTPSAGKTSTANIDQSQLI